MNVRHINFHIILLLPFLWRVAYSGHLVAFIVTGDRSGYLYSLANEGFLAAGFFACLYVASYVSRWLSFVIRAGIFLGYLFLIVDLTVLKNFYSRLNVFDIPLYAGSVLDYVTTSFVGWQVVAILVAVLVLALVVFCFQAPRLGRLPHSLFFLCVVMGMAKWGAAQGNQYVESWIYRDALTYNLEVASERKPYSDEFLSQLDHEEHWQCHKLPPQQKNIIVLMVESLSSYQSQLFSGVHHWTPQVDRIARENTYFTRFYANGFATVDGEIAMLLGELPLFAPSVHVEPGQSSLAGFYGRPSALPVLLNDHGYDTRFYTTSTLRFSDTGNWASSNGFSFVEGSDYPGYEELPRFHFSSVEDKYLFQRLQKALAETDTQPYFWFVKTVSTHHPFVDPVTRHYSEERAFRYVDKQVGDFYHHLQASGFFESGMLFIVGDHRAMRPIQRRESQQLGLLRAPASVPMIVVGDWLEGMPKGEVSQMFQQTDIYQAVKSMVTGEHCRSDWVGDIWTQTPARYVLHRRGDRRNYVSVFSEQGDWVLRLAGDNTRVVEAPADAEAEGDSILNTIHRVRGRPVADEPDQ